MYIYLLIALGGALGSVTRHWLSNVVLVSPANPFPWGTFWVNVSGCLVMGFVAALTVPGSRPYVGNEARFLLMSGFCGGYTTFSAFSLQTMELLRLGDWPRALAYVAGSVVVCLLGIWLGHLLATPFAQAQ
jgi:fluoride exporter